MRLMTYVAAAAVAALLAAGPASAQTGMKNGSADVNTTKAKCSPGDPNVMVDPKTKMYMMDTSADTAMTSGSKTSGTTAGTTPNDNGKAEAGAATGGSAAAGGAMTGKSGAMTGMKSMCKSEADSMGAKMMPAPKKM